MESKKCTKCGDEKKLSEYNRHYAGYRSECKVCSRLREKEYRDSGRRKKASRLANIAYEKTQKARDRKARHDKKNLHPAKKKARAAVHSSVKTGKIPPIKTQKCNECGNGADHYHHHAGYDKSNWLNVIPICVKCHNLAHREG